MSLSNEKTKLHKLKIHLIDTKESLFENINFLENGFGWSSSISKNLLNKLLINNESIKFYGIKLTNQQGTILGSLLIFYQGVTKENIKMINLSSIYVEPKTRGIGSIYMLKLTIELLSDFIITNVSPSPAVNKILTKFGFYKGFYVNHNFNIFNFILKLNIIKILSLKNLKILHNKKNFYLLNDIKYQIGDSLKLKLDINEQVLTLIILECKIPKNLFSQKVNFKMIKILWTSNKILFKNYFKYILIFLMIKRKSLFVTTHIEIPESFEKINISSEQLIFNNTNVSIDYLSIGSELSFY